MIEDTTYKILHIAGIFFLLFSLSSTIILSRNKIATSRTLYSMIHGISLFIIIFSGFGMLAKIDINNASDWQIWVWVKLIIWLVMGISVYLIKRFPKYSNYFWFLIPILAVAASYFAVIKPSY